MSEVTPGALRAARKLVELNKSVIFSPGSMGRIAEIIDDETGTREMLEALEFIAEFRVALIAKEWEPGSPTIIEMMHRAEAAIQKAKAGQ